MADKKYPTRMHEVLGVEPNEEFYINGELGIFFLTKEGYLTSDNAGRNSNWIVHAINHGITRRPRLTEEQVAMLRALRLLDMQYLTKNSSGTEMSAWKDKPGKGVYFWEGWYIQARLSDSVIAVIGDLVSWDDPYPLDIVQTLREAGRLEVEA